MKTLTLFLGPRCNANCSYCHAAKSETEGSSDPSVLFYDYLNVQMKTNPGLTIRFLGGEPTLYMETIKAMVAFCQGYNVSYVVTTNGLQLYDKQIVEFFNEHNFYVTVSFDGIRGIRGYADIFYLPEYLESLRSINNLGCSMTLSRNNAIMAVGAKEIGLIENKLGRTLPFRPHYVHATTEAVAAMSFTAKQARSYAEDYIRAVDKFITDCTKGIFNLKLYPLFMLLYKSINKNYSFPETRCFNKDYVQLDLAGNCYLCTYERSSSNYLGRVDDKTTLMANMGNILETRRPECLNCEFYRYCGSHCLASVRPKMECAIRKRLFAWFLDRIERTRMDFKNLQEQEFVKRSGGFYELYR